MVSLPQAPHQNPVRNSPLPHTRYRPRPSHSSRFDHPHNIWWGAQIIKLLIRQFYPIPCYLVPLRPKYLPPHSILEHPYTMFLPQCETRSSTLHKTTGYITDVIDKTQPVNSGNTGFQSAKWNHQTRNWTSLIHYTSVVYDQALKSLKIRGQSVGPSLVLYCTNGQLMFKHVKTVRKSMIGAIILAFLPFAPSYIKSKAVKT